MKYPVGTKYIDRRNRENVVTDYYTTTNLDGEIIQERYVVSRMVCGCVFHDRDVVQTEIDMAIGMIDQSALEA